ncbi:multidrug efflux pump [Sphingomonas sp. YR710]|uniref:efflux RND transporter permease subunit n=1 Tax=Sphingomonas sp. YR710 TaxID=1882773 RepID=UPI0008857210|nr:efflux RND transporter permease subunit [Sphingomonas sp. YR710]SDC77491.1 multidrug efflux pump [Sphingomonas sp. YR710]
MNLSAPFIRRPIGTLLLTVGLALAGIAAFFVLPVAPLPQVDFPTVNVQASLAGASPATMASSVASPLEKRLGTIAGVTEMTSQSGVGSTRITLQFDLSRDVDGAARDVQAAINAARADLPATLRTNPTYRKANPADAPIMIVALTSKTRSPAEIYDAVSTVVQQRLLQVEGVGDVELGGAALPAVRIELHPLALARYGIALEDVRSALSSTSANRPRGVIEGKDLAWQVYGDAPAQHADDYRNIPIASRGGSLVRLSDVASVYDGPEDVRTMGLFNGQRAVTVVLSRQPGANIVATVDAIKAQLPGLEAALPADIKLTVASDRTTTIRASLHEVEITLVIATLLVVAVVSVFLRSLRATVVPAVAVVVSLLGTLGVMYLAGFSLNNLSLMALTVATGFVVDDAIVVLENISRHVEDGVRPIDAALRGAREVGFTVLSISVSLVAVFIPLLFMGGIIGRLFREFAITMSVAVLISLVISLTTTPMLAALLLKGEPKPNRFTRFSERQFDRLHRQYARSLDWALANRGAVLIILAGTVALNIFLISVASKGFFPEQDTGALQGGLRADQSISFQDMQQKLGQIVRIIRHDKDVATVVAFTGGARAGGGFMFVNLKPERQRDASRAIIARLRPKLARISGIGVFLNPVQDMRVGGRQSNSTYQYTLKADDMVTLKSAGAKLVELLKAESALTDVDIDQQDGGANVYVTVDRDTASRLGINNQAVDAALYDAFGQRQVATIYSGLNQYHVVMGVAPQFNGSPEALQQVYVPGGNAATTSTTTATTGSTPVSTTGSSRDTSTGSAVSLTPKTAVPLSAIAHWKTGSTAAQVNHQDGQPSATISFNTANNVSLGTAAQRITAVQQSAGFPASVHGNFAGTAKVFAQSTATMPLLILAALVVIYIVLGILYESAIHPLTVLSTLPSAGIGAVLALMLTGSDLDMIALIGIILLIGIVKKNAIMIIDFALDAERARGLTPFAAIREASLLRFRPILMTTAAAALGALPLAIGFGEGAELRRPLGIAIVGGLIASQFITLLTTPVVYLALDRFRRRGIHERELARHGKLTPRPA